jgi:hypothetical protein
VVFLGVCFLQMMWVWWMSRTGIDPKLELWRRTLEAKGFKLSRSKTECMTKCLKMSCGGPYRSTKF